MESQPTSTSITRTTARSRLLGPDATLENLVAEAGTRLEGMLAVLRLPQFDLTLTYEVAAGRCSGAPLRPGVRKLLAVTQLSNPETPLPVRLEHGGPALGIAIHDAEHRPAGALAVIRSTEGRPFTPAECEALQALGLRLALLLQRHHDEMTGVLTRAAFETRAARTLADLLPAGRTLALLHVDVDRMHVINETHGYAVGDDVLRLCARALAARAPEGALLGRTAGDRFTMLLPATSEVDACEIAARLSDAVRAVELETGGQRLLIAASLGVTFIDEIVPLEDAQNCAQLACRLAKERGGGRAELYSCHDSSVIRRENEVFVLGEIAEAARLDQFQLLAQPIVGLGPERTVPGFELLLRLRRDGELLLPGQFLGAAERYQLMPTVDRWVVEHALRALAPHADTIGAAGARFALNLSGQSLSDPQFVDWFEQTLRGHPGLGSRLCVEVTETVAITRLERAVALMRRLGELGCEFALDDFGAGMSSFAYLRDLPVQRLKIDGSFVRDLASDRVAEAMVKATREVATTLGLTIVAEGVESDASRRSLEALGIPQAQGFLFGVPRPLATVLATTLPALARRAQRPVSGSVAAVAAQVLGSHATARNRALVTAQPHA